MSSQTGQLDGAATRALADVAQDVLAGPPRLGPVRLVSVDGPACAGKTTVAGLLAAALGDVQVVHMDDLYEGWDGLPTVAGRLEAWVLGPIRAGVPGRYRRYDWGLGAYAEWHDVPLRPALVVEGVGSASRAVEADASLRIWVDAPLDVRFARGEARDGGGFGPYWDAWAAAEHRHFAAEDTCARADLRLDGAPDIAYDPAREVVVTHARR